MISSINISDKELEFLTKREFNKGIESTTYIFNENGKSKILKIFKTNEHLENKLKKIHIMNDRLKKCDFVVQAEKTVKNNGNTIGYIMPKVKGKNFHLLDYSRIECIHILKQLSIKLKRLHQLGIVTADFQLNFMIDNNNELKLIDYDNFAIDNLYVDTENIYLQKYKQSISKFDKNFDNYLLNIFTISCLTRTFAPFLYDQFDINPNKIYFKDEEINKIIFNTFNLQKQYNEDLIVDKINTKQDLKKIKQKIF